MSSATAAAPDVLNAVKAHSRPKTMSFGVKGVVMMDHIRPGGRNWRPQN